MCSRRDRTKPGPEAWNNKPCIKWSSIKLDTAREECEDPKPVCKKIPYTGRKKKDNLCFKANEKK